MAADDLTRPLGLAKPRTAGGFVRLLKIAVGVSSIMMATGVVWFLLIQDPNSSQSGVVAVVGEPGAPASAPPAGTGTIAVDPITTATTTPSAPAAPSGRPGLTEILPDGKITEIGVEEAVITNPNDPAPLRLASLPAEELSESGRHGLLPSIGPDGTRPMDAYARPSERQSSDAGIPIAIIVGGIGISEIADSAAILDLPGAVTLAFAPYGKNLPPTLAMARASGHEILLQVPLEPYGYPSNDPGPHTLTVDASTEENIDRLHWLMSRITNYVGVTNYLGARFTGEETAFGPVIAEIGSRGLLYFDDGTSSTSRAEGLARGRTPFARADIVLDAVTEDRAIDARLAELEDIARRRGYAIAAATAFPVTIERIARFVESAAAKGIEIVPISALADVERR